MLHIAKSQKTKLQGIALEKAIFEVKDCFKKSLSKSLKLSQVNAPLFVKANSGINDDLNGIESPAGFIARSYPGQRFAMPSNW